ncbi:hypothetical protein [Actinoplanes sp. NPDC026619]|uniref:hypothetical protein n=1 Tax=Actinoplanes sp. NPDC026619 TaxID=3155798 RepID=UPI0033DA3EDF
MCDLIALARERSRRADIAALLDRAGDDVRIIEEGAGGTITVESSSRRRPDRTGT